MLQFFVLYIRKLKNINLFDFEKLKNIVKDKCQILIYYSLVLYEKVSKKIIKQTNVTIFVLYIQKLKNRYLFDVV